MVLTHAMSSCPRAQSWLGWTMSGVAAYLGYVPGSEPPARQLPSPSDADIQELYAELGFDPARPVLDAGRDALHGSLDLTLDLTVSIYPAPLSEMASCKTCACSLQCHSCLACCIAHSAWQLYDSSSAEPAMQVNAASLMVLDSPRLGQQLLPEAEQVLSLELGGVSVHAHQHGASLGASASVYDITAHDLCTHGSGVSEVLLARWHAGGRLRLPQSPLCLEDQPLMSFQGHALCGVRRC